MARATSHLLPTMEACRLKRRRARSTSELGAAADGERGRSPGCRPSMAAAASGGGPPAGEEEGEAQQRVGAAANDERVEAARDRERRGRG